MSNKPLALVIEDQPDVANIFSTALKSAGYETAVIHDGQQALDWLEESTPSLVALDLHLPNVSGQDILRYIRSTERLAKIYVLCMSADARMSDSLRSEVDFTLDKPVSFRQLRDIAQRLL